MNDHQRCMLPLHHHYHAEAVRVQWKRLASVRTAVLSIGGFASFCLAAFLWCAIAGFVVLGVSLLALEFLTSPLQDAS